MFTIGIKPPFDGHMTLLTTLPTSSGTALGLRPRALRTFGYTLVHYTPYGPAWGVFTIIILILHLSVRDVPV